MKLPWGRGNKEQELDAEIGTHLEASIRERMERGATRAEAEAAARREFGNVALVKDTTRDVWGLRWLDDLAQDLRFGVRQLRRNPGFTLVAVLTLALGIGGTTAVFSVIHAVLLQPLPFDDPDRLVAVWERRPSSITANIPISGHEFAAWRERNRVFEGAAMYEGFIPSLTGSGEPQPVEGLRTTAEIFDVLGVRPVLGRAFLPGEDQPGQNRVAVLSHQFWQQRFGGDAAILNKTIRLNDENYTVVGVMPRISATLEPDVWVPMDLPLEVRRVGKHSLSVVARLKPGMTVQQAQADLDRVALELAREMPGENTDHAVAVISAKEDVVGEVRRPLLVLLAAVGCVLLIACANVANLMLARAAVRCREMAVRTALGAGRVRLVRQLLTENLLLSALGGGAGLLLAVWLTDLFPRITAVSIPLLDRVAVNGAMLAAAAGLSLLAGMLTGLAPAFRGPRLQLGQWLGQGTRSSSEPAVRRIGGALVAVEVALALVLLVGAGLLMRSFARLVQVDPGFQTEDIMVMSVSLPGTRYATPESRRTFFNQLHERLNTVPGVESAGGSSHLPLNRGDNWMPYAVEGAPPAEPGREPYAPFRVVAPDYFRTLGIPLRAGRFFSDADARLAVPVVRWYPQQPNPPQFDQPQPPPVTIVSEAFARQHWPGQDPVGKRMRVIYSPWLTVVGVVGDVRHGSLESPPYGHIYMPYAQEPWPHQDIVVRAAGDPARLNAALRQQVRALDAALPVSLTTMNDLVSQSVGQRRFYAVLIVVFGGVALALTLVGIFGVTSYAVAQRTQEIGVRLALGALPADIVRQVAGQGVFPAVAGVVAGTAGALGLTRLLDRLLYGVTPTDPLIFAGVCALVMAASFAACWLPARRASRVDPMVALRHE